MAQSVPPAQEEQTARLQGDSRFTDIWIAREQRDVTEDILVFLEHPSKLVRARAVQALGRLENRETVPPLERIFHQNKVSPIRVLMSLARIRSRHLKGRARVEVVANSVGLSWREVVRLSQKVDDARPYAGESVRDIIMNEMVDLLYTMADRGEDAEALTKSLTLDEYQRVKLKAAPLPTEQEIKFILDDQSQSVVLGDNSQLARHIIELGSPATELLIQRLQDMKQAPQRYSGLKPSPGRPGAYQRRMAFAFLFRVAAETHDNRLLPLIWQFQNDNYPREVQREAANARYIIERNTALLG